MKHPRNPKQALHDGKPHLSLSPPSPGPKHIGHPVPKGSRGTEYWDRNPMHDTEPRSQDEGHADPIRTQLHHKGVK
jgi:hypothetical protein